MRYVPLLTLGTSLLLPIGIASAEPVETFKFAPDSTQSTTTTTDQGIGHPMPQKLPMGLPGWYDPTTREFKPAADAAAPAATQTVAGTVTVTINVSVPKGVVGDDTVFCDLLVEFGNVAGSPPQWFPNHSERASTNFGVADAPVDLSRAFRYTTNGNGSPKMRLTLTCTIPNAFDGSAHGQTDYLAVQALQNGNVTRTINMDL